MSATKDEIEMWVRRIRARYPEESGRFTSKQLEDSMPGWLDLLEPLQLAEHGDQVRSISLCVLLTPEQRRSKLVQGVLKRIMAHLEWDAKLRLDFVYKHLVGRPVSPDEEDFGPKFIPF